MPWGHVVSNFPHDSAEQQRPHATFVVPVPLGGRTLVSYLSLLAAFRETDNGEDFLRHVNAELGIPVEIIGQVVGSWWGPVDLGNEGTCLGWSLSEWYDGGVCLGFGC